MNAVINYLDKIPKKFIPVLGVLLVFLLGFVDHITGYEISFSIFYLLPILFVSWFGKTNHAVVVSFVSAATWLWADLTAGHTYSYLLIPLWNSIMRLGFFLIATFSVSTIKNILEREKAMARIDYLTEAINSRAFYETAQKEIDRSARFNRPFTIAYVDIDDFKQVNDTLGHGEGDRLLRSVAQAIKGNIRSIDIVSRMGGDEFAMLMPETDAEDAKVALEKVRGYLLDIVKTNSWPVTFSIGAVTCYKPCNLEELINEADGLMYSVKTSGKNRIDFKIHDDSRYQKSA